MTDTITMKIWILIMESDPVGISGESVKRVEKPSTLNTRITDNYPGFYLFFTEILVRLEVP